MTNETLEFLQECKKAGYERVTIFIADERVPDSVKIRKINTGWDVDEDGLATNGGFHPKTGFIGNYWGNGSKSGPHKVVCGYPEIKGLHPHLPTKSDGSPRWPAMWGIVKRLDLSHSGGGHLEGHDVDDRATSLLDAGYYDLSEIAM